jgi:hypothetical protein
MKLTPEEKTELVDYLSERLHDKMEHLDPVGSKWPTLDSHEKEFYRSCVGCILSELWEWERRRALFSPQ